jgi:hypothetical protein
MPKALSYRVQAKILFRKKEEEEEDFASILNLILFVKNKIKMSPAYCCLGPTTGPCSPVEFQGTSSIDLTVQVSPRDASTHYVDEEYDRTV